MSFIAPLVLWVGTTFGVSATTAAMIVGTVLSTGLSLAIKGVTGLFQKGISKATLSNDSANHSVTTRQAAAARRVIYGRDLVGGIFTFQAVSGDTNEFLHLVITFAGHEIDAFEEIWFGDELVPFYQGAATGKYAGYVRKEENLGDGVDHFSWLRGAVPQFWTDAHRQEGCASLHLELKYNADLFTSGIPNVRAKIRGKKVYDPRVPNDPPAWSDNVALCQNDYLAQPEWGLGATADEIDEELVIAAANICDELVATHTGTEKRYTCNGTFDMSERPADVIKDILTAMSGRIAYVGGKWRMYAGAYREPSLTFSDDDLRGAITVTLRRSRRDLCNGVKGTFIDPNNSWQATDFPSYWRSSSRGYEFDPYLVEDAGIANFRGAWTADLGQVVEREGVSIGDNVYCCIVDHVASDANRPGGEGDWQTYWKAGERIWRDVEYRFTKSASMCQRLSKIELESSRRQITGELPCKLGGLMAAPPEVIRFNHPRFGWELKTFEIAQLKLAIDAGGDAPMPGVDLSVAETDADIYAWTAADDVVGVTAAEIPPPSETNTSTLGGVLEISQYEIPPPISRPVSGVVVVRWEPPTDQAALAGHTFVMFKKQSDSVWLQYSQLSGSIYSTLCGGLTPGTTYDFKVYNVNIYGIEGPPATGSYAAG